MSFDGRLTLVAWLSKQLLLLDASGRIYVTDASTASILVYAANPSGTLNEAPSATITGNATTLLAPYGIYVH